MMINFSLMWALAGEAAKAAEGGGLNVTDLQWAAQFGAVFVLAVVMFHFYRQDRKDSQDQLRIIIDRMLAGRTESDKRFAEATNEFRAIVRENTSAFSNVSVTLRAIEQNLGEITRTTSSTGNAGRHH